ncbi:transposase [Streptomyces syringium]|uniref:transposase n=1 Tax=Streptomyces syringium TaxID=76729 RepID=UPI003F54CC24
MILDSQSVKGAETVGAATRGFDAGKKINGRKRHLAVDMRGMPLKFMVAPATNRDDQPARDLLSQPSPGQQLSLRHHNGGADPRRRQGASAPVVTGADAPWTE